MITIQHEITHHGMPFSIIAAQWPCAMEAARAVASLRAWVERQGPTQSRVLHFVVAARQEHPAACWRIIELDEADEAAQAARAAGLPDYCEQPPQGRSVVLQADHKGQP
jgi:hypothetical protein